MSNSSSLIVVCGHPVSGKTTLANLLAKELNFHLVDIDRVRKLAFGDPHPRPNESAELMARDRQEMLHSYRAMLDIAGACAEMNKSVIITATFSRQSYRDSLKSLISAYPRVSLAIVQCMLSMPTIEEENAEVQRRLSRPFDSAGAVTTLERYWEVKNRFEPMNMDQLVINTAPPQTVRDSATKVFHFLAHNISN